MRAAALIVVATASILVACTEKDRASTPLPDAAPPPSVPPAPAASERPPSIVAPARAAPRPAPAASVPPSEWTWKTYRGEGFTVRFPGDPKVKVLPAEEDRVGYTEASFEAPGGLAAFVAGFSDYEKRDVENPSTFLDDHLGQPRRGFTEILHQRAITLAGGHPGRVVILRRNLSGTPLRVYSRLYLVGRRLYSLIVSTLDEDGVGEDVVKKFMESFKLQ
jgi:hypothetical protein